MNLKIEVILVCVILLASTLAGCLMTSKLGRSGDSGIRILGLWVSTNVSGEVLYFFLIRYVQNPQLLEDMVWEYHPKNNSGNESQQGSIPDIIGNKSSPFHYLDSFDDGILNGGDIIFTNVSTLTFRPWDIRIGTSFHLHDRDSQIILLERETLSREYSTRLSNRVNSTFTYLFEIGEENHSLNNEGGRSKPLVQYSLFVLTDDYFSEGIETGTLSTGGERVSFRLGNYSGHSISHHDMLTLDLEGYENSTVVWTTCTPKSFSEIDGSCGHYSSWFLIVQEVS